MCQECFSRPRNEMDVQQRFDAAQVAMERLNDALTRVATLGENEETQWRTDDGWVFKTNCPQYGPAYQLVITAPTPEMGKLVRAVFQINSRRDDLGVELTLREK